VSEQADWEVMLNGDAQQLRHITKQPFRQDYIRVWGGIDDWNDCPNDYFSFNSVYFNGLSEDQVWLVAYELISLLNGASEIFQRNTQKYSIHGITFKENILEWRDKTQISGLLKKPAVFSQAAAHEQLRNGLKTSAEIGLTILATENKDAYLLLKFLDLCDGWVGYYKILDTIKTLEKKKISRQQEIALKKTSSGALPIITNYPDLMVVTDFLIMQMSIKPRL
jgi:hypothetical protein